MNTEKHVTSLEVSQKLSALGVNKESLFCWQQNIRDEWYINDSKLLDFLSDCYPAYLASELAEMLPNKITINGMDYFLDIYPDEEKKSPGWIVGYNYMRANLGFKEYTYQEADSLPDALGKILIYLIENRLIQL